MSDEYQDAVRKAMAAAQRGLAETLRPLKAPSFDTSILRPPQLNMVNIPTLFDSLSAGQAIGAIANEIDALQKETPENKHLVITMLTSDGQIMDVELVKAIGFSVFLAKGYINKMPCTVMAHISTLNLFFAYEEKRAGRTRLGFVIEVPEAIQPPLEPEPQPSGKKKPARGRAKR